MNSLREEDSEVRLLKLFRRYWPLVVVLVVAAAWWPALDYLSDFRKPDVPLVTTPHDVVAAMLDLAKVSDKDTVYDLGSGDGRILLAAARDRGARAVGIELDPKLVESSRAAIQAAGLSDKVRVERGDIFKTDLRPATVVTMYLKSTVNVELRPQLDQLRPGTRIVSHQFGIRGVKPDKHIEMHSEESNLDHDVYLWVAPLHWE
jgi:SAM-dependent methyltransferase